MGVQFKMGTLVSYVKAYIQEQYGHPMGKMVREVSCLVLLVGDGADQLSVCAEISLKK